MRPRASLLAALLVGGILRGLLVPETLLWSDDFDYPNDAALEAAYPYEFDSGVTSVSSAIDLVAPGPTGYATGIDSKGVSADYGPSFDVAQWIIHPTGRCFHFRGVWQIDTVDTINSGQSLVNMRAISDDGVDYYGQYWQLSVIISDLTALQLTVNGGNGTVGDYPTPAYTSGYVTGLLTPNAANQIDVSGFTSSLTETAPGVFAPAADGSVVVAINGVNVMSWSGIVWNWTDSLPAMQWNLFELHPSGTFSGLRIWSCGSAVTAPTIDNSVPCCKDATAGTGATGGTLPPDDRVPLPPFTSMCPGGGVGPDGNSPTFSEDWTVA